MGRLNLKLLVASFMIIEPYPFYLDAKTAGTLMRRRFADSLAMEHAIDNQRDRWEYYVTFIAQTSGYWLPVGYGADSKYRWAGYLSAGANFAGQEIIQWSKDRPTLIGRFSLWTAFWKMRDLDRSFQPRKVKYRRTLKQIIRQLVARAKAAVVAPPPAPTWVYTAPLSNHDIEAVNKVLSDEALDEAFQKILPEPMDPDFVMPVGSVPTVNMALIPKTLKYNWKSTSADKQAIYQAAKWVHVPPKRHPELSEFKVGRRIVWGGMVLMQCSSAAYRKMEKGYADQAWAGFDKSHKPIKHGEVVAHLGIYADDEK